MQYEIKKTEIDHIFEEKARYAYDVIVISRLDIDIAGDLVAGALLSRLVYWDERKSIVRDGHKWFAKSVIELYEEIGITEKQYKRCIKVLQDKGIVIKKHYMFNSMRTNHFRIDRKAYQDYTRKVSTGSVMMDGPVNGHDGSIGSDMMDGPLTKNTNKDYSKRVYTHPDDFVIDDSLKGWAKENKYHRLSEHLAYFQDYVRARPKKAYKDWKAAFRNAVRKNWADLPNEPTSNELLEAQWERMEANGAATQ